MDLYNLFVFFLGDGFWGWFRQIFRRGWRLEISTHDDSAIRSSLRVPLWDHQFRIASISSNSKDYTYTCNHMHIYIFYIRITYCKTILNHSSKCWSILKFSPSYQSYHLGTRSFVAGNLPGSADDGFRRIPSLAPLCLDVRDQKTATPVAGDQPATKKLVDIAGSCFCFFFQKWYAIWQ